MKTPNEGTNELAIEKWNIYLANNGQDLSKEEIQQCRRVFLSGYDNGHDDLLDNMREIYNDDPCEFDELFHIDSIYETGED